MPQKEKNQKRKDKPKNIFFALSVVCLAVAAVGYVLWQLETKPRTDDAYAYAETIGVTPEVSGRIEMLSVKDNQAVKQGELLVSIEQETFKLNFEKAQAAIVTLKQEIKEAERNISVQKHQATAARKKLERAQAATEQAQSTLARLKPLKKKGFVSAEQFDLAKTAVTQAVSEQEAATAAMQAAESAVGNTDVLTARLTALESDKALAALHLEHTQVTAPFDGRVLGVRTAIGHFAAMGRPLFTLIDTQNWYVFANFRETDLKKIKPGAKAVVYLMSNTEKKFDAVVDSVGFGVHPDDGGLMIEGLPVVKRSLNWVRVAQRFPVKFKVLNPDPDSFRIGASATVVVTDE